MNGFPTMSPIFGLLFALAGLTLAVILGLALYPSRKQEKASPRQSFKAQKEGKTA